MKRTVAFACGGILLIVGLLKLEQVAVYVFETLGSESARTVAAPRIEHVVALVLEVVVGVLFFIPRCRLHAAFGATSLGVVFCVFTVIRGGFKAPCGCLGRLPLTYGEELFLAVLIVVLGAISLMFEADSGDVGRSVQT